MHEYVRLCVECNRHSWSCPVKRLRVSLACLVWFVFVRLCLAERLSGAERARAAMSSAPAEPSGLERPFRAPQQSRTGSSGHFERPSGAERARAAISSAPAEPSGLERPFRAPQRSRAGSSGRFERPSGAERARAAISSAPAAPRRARAAISSHLRLRARLERPFRAPQRGSSEAERVRPENAY